MVTGGDDAAARQGDRRRRLRCGMRAGDGQGGRGDVLGERRGRRGRMTDGEGPGQANVPAEAKELKAELAGMLPFAPIASLLIELDVRTHFLDCFTHAGGRKQARSADLKRNILSVLIANATNLGLARMAEACGIPYDVLRWTQEWYVREETLREANTCIVNHHHGLDLSKVFGGGTMSSSDGQRFPVRGKSTTARDMTIHGGQVLSSYTHVSDQHSTFGTKIIVPNAREAHFVLDDFLGNATDLPLFEHATDTHGVTLINFALFDLVGKLLSPRIRDLGKITLIRDETPTDTVSATRTLAPC
ncbi:Tn3 family transposase [Nonomuraea sp. NPDC050022]|uniref:Tn3 family transposase n=1 Tax=Nonomuraea sp. NPDC050022 TaxID=3364358 RepID=UPI0037991E17